MAGKKDAELRDELAAVAEDANAQVGNIEALRRYWTTGEGGARIRWGTDGDLTRCHRLVRREVPRTDMSDDDVWGFCNNLHKRLFGRPNPRD